jgi:hypothetical protein
MATRKQAAARAKFAKAARAKNKRTKVGRAAARRSGASSRSRTPFVGCNAVLSSPVASCQDAREGGFVASCERARLLTWALVAGPALLVVIVSSCAVRAWIWRWVAAGLIRE